MLSERTRSIRGVVIENNKFCISVHYRQVRDEVCVIHSFVFINGETGKKITCDLDNCSLLA